jgi:hypothetical protein
VRFVFDGVPGVSLALNPRLRSGSPSGWLAGPTRKSNDTPLSDFAAPNDLVSRAS